LAAEAHAHGLAYGLKNDLDEVPQLVADADFAINEECFQYNECDGLQPFIDAGKAVFQVEYTVRRSRDEGREHLSAGQRHELRFADQAPRPGTAAVLLP